MESKARKPGFRGSPRGAGPAGEVWIEGARPVLEALRAGRRELYEVWLPPVAGSPVQEELRSRASERGLVIHAVDRAGEVRARGRPLPQLGFEVLLQEAPSPRFLVALDGVTDVGNLGSIARSAETAGAHGLLLELRRSPPVSGAALKISSGALEHLPVARTPNLGRALDLARSEGCRILAADMSGDPLDQLTPAEVTQDVIWLLGSEDRGIRPTLRTRVDRWVRIPLRGRIDSLGVAAAAAVVLHHSGSLRALGELPTAAPEGGGEGEVT